MPADGSRDTFASSSPRLADVQAVIGRGRVCMRQRVFAEAVEHFHSAAWTAARAGLTAERLDAQRYLADALLRSRQFRAALAGFRFAQRLAEESSPDSASYWFIRARLAQALTRNGRLDEARGECDAVRRRLGEGPLDDASTAREIELFVRHAEAQLRARRGELGEAARLASDLGAELEADGRHAKAGLQHFNASLWSAAAAELEGGEDRAELYQQALREGDRAAAMIAVDAESERDENVAEGELLRALLIVVGVKLGVIGDDGLVEVTAILDGLEAREQDRSPGVRAQLLLLRGHVAERRGAARQLAAVAADLQRLAATEGESLYERLRQAYAARFRWHGPTPETAGADDLLARLLTVAEPGEETSCES